MRKNDGKSNLKNDFFPGNMIKKRYKIVIAIIAIVFIVATGEFILTSEIAPLPSDISVVDYFGLSVVGIILNILLAIILYIEYRMSEENAGEFYFSVAFLANVVYILYSLYASFQLIENTSWMAVNDIYVSYFFRQINFVIMSFFAVKITTRCERKFYHKLTRYLAVFVFLSVFVIAVSGFGGGELSGNDSAVFSFYSLYFLVGAWIFVFWMTVDEYRIKPECRELLMFFALSGVVCNLMMTAVAAGASYPWYLSKMIDVISMLIVGGVLSGRLMNHITQAGSALHRDAVTGVYNRNYFRSSMSVILDGMSDDIRYCIIMCSIENFREINHDRGNEFGDYILKNVANVLLMHVGEMDVVARTGGRSFFIMLHEADGVHFCSRIRAGISCVSRNTGVPLNVRITYQVIEGESATFDNIFSDMENRSKAV
ncbi:GGDEF domain-containing protein [Escherichia coli]|uniref:sensor domain-containing diguanylate cyclase n=1 Tax=Escherichia coli TaxID=562 RepID=UPI0018E45D74|nr:diguanylate cyclase [Escherichia coli]